MSTMSETRDQRRRSSEAALNGVPGAFATFVLAHSECGEQIEEFRLEKNTVASWCLRCGEVGVFGPTHRKTRVQTRKSERAEL